MYCIKSVMVRCHVKNYKWLRQVHLTDIVRSGLLDKRQYARIMS